MAIEEFLADKIFTIESFIEIVEAVDFKIKNEPNNERLKKVQGALYEILTKAHEFETRYKRPDQLFPYDTLIEMIVITGQHIKLSYREEVKRRIV